MSRFTVWVIKHCLWVTTHRFLCRHQASMDAKLTLIYFTDDNFEFYGANGGGYDMGVFRMEDGNTSKHYPVVSLTHFSTPLWYI